MTCHSLQRLENDSGITLCVKKKVISATSWSNESHITHTHTGIFCISDFSPVIRLLYICALHSSDVTNALRAPRGAFFLSVRPSMTLSLYTHTPIFVAHFVPRNCKNAPLDSASCHCIVSVVYLCVKSCNIRCVLQRGDGTPS